MRVALVMAVSALAGCGSQSAGELPPPAGPPHSPPPAVRPAGEVMNGSAPVREGGRPALADGRVAVVAPRARKLELHGRSAESAPAGVGPTHVACLPAGPCWVLDTRGDALLVFSLRPHLELVRRLYLPGGPYGVALDPARRRLWITLPALNELVELPAHGRPHVLRRFATVRQPDAVAVDPRSGRVLVMGRAGVQRIDP